MIERYFWLVVGIAAALVGIWHGMTSLIGEEIMVTAARGVATAGVYTVQYGLMIGIPIAGAWALFLVFAAPIGLIKRFLISHREKYARVKAIEADTLAVVADAKGRYRQSQYITVAGRSALAIDTQTGRHKWYAASAASMDVEEPAFSPNLDAQFDATQLFEQIYQRTNGQQNAPSLIIAGRKRSGKSTFAEWITNQYADEIDFVLVDPKQDDPLINWGPTTTVLARNSNWREFADHIDQFLEEVKTWRVDRNRKKRIYIIDEWLTVSGIKANRYGEKFFDFMQRVLTEMAYLGVGVILLPHATTATALKFPSGYAQLRDCFDGIFRFKHNLLTGQ